MRGKKAKKFLRYRTLLHQIPHVGRQAWPWKVSHSSTLHKCKTHSSSLKTPDEKLHAVPLNLRFCTSKSSFQSYLQHGLRSRSTLRHGRDRSHRLVMSFSRRCHKSNKVLGIIGREEMYVLQPIPPKLQDLTFLAKPHIQKPPQVVTALTVSTIRPTKLTLSVLEVDIF